MPKIKIAHPAPELEHEVLHAHIDFAAKTIAYQLEVGGPMHHAPLSELAAEALEHDLASHAQEHGK